MNSWKINRRVTRTEGMIIYILAQSAGIVIDNIHRVESNDWSFISMTKSKEIGFYSSLSLPYDHIISYETAIKFLEEKIKEREI